MNTKDEKVEVKIVCPICKTEEELCIPKSIINYAKQLTTISIQKGLICEHHFQAFIDKNFKVRGYQKIDFEFEPKYAEEKNEINKRDARIIDHEEDLFNNLVLEGNIIEYKPKSANSKNFGKDAMENTNKNKKMTLEEIYEQFWEFIDENNPQFKELIIKDKRRTKASTIAFI
ncbi:MAG: hypothetical protein ACFFAO_16225 [Candidatus Hermodarchaeota archaeon]